MSAPGFVERFFLAWSTFFRVLFDPEFARGLLADRAAPPASLGPEPAALEAESDAEPSPPGNRSAASDQVGPGAAEGALQLLGLLQREGRLVDFVQQEVASFSDAEVGRAARVVHDGCRAALKRCVCIEPVLDEPEGAATVVPRGFEPNAIKLVGSLAGSAPYRGTLRHKGWRASSIQLPETLDDHAFEILAPAEVECSRA